MKSHISCSPSLSRGAPAVSLEMLTPSQGEHDHQRAVGDILQTPSSAAIPALPSPHRPVPAPAARVSVPAQAARWERRVPVFLARVSHGATVAWKPPPADTITAPDPASPRSRAFC